MVAGTPNAHKRYICTKEKDNRPGRYLWSFHVRSGSCRGRSVPFRAFGCVCVRPRCRRVRSACHLWSLGCLRSIPVRPRFVPEPFAYNLMVVGFVSVPPWCAMWVFRFCPFHRRSLRPPGHTGKWTERSRALTSRTGMDRTQRNRSRRPPWTHEKGTLRPPGKKTDHPKGAREWTE